MAYIMIWRDVVYVLFLVPTISNAKARLRVSLNAKARPYLCWLLAVKSLYSMIADFLAYIQEDASVLPRAAIITVSGLGGIVAGYRGQLPSWIIVN